MFMNRHLVILAAVLAALLQTLGQQLTKGEKLYSRDFDVDGNPDWEARIVVFHDTLPSGGDRYEVRTQFHASPDAAVLKAGNSRTEFQLGELISTNMTIYVNHDLGVTDLWLLQYSWTVFEPAKDLFGEFLSRTSVIAGAKYTDPDTGDVTLGWFKFSRPSTEPGTAFTLESWAYNPISNEPIRAGEPPDLPEPSFAWSTEDVTVSWPEKAAMLRLERTASLTPPVQWQPVETGGATSVTLPLSEGQEAYFRLVVPEL